MFNNKTLLFKYNIDESGNPVSIKVDNEQKQVSINGTIQMEFIPDEFNSINMLGENNQPMYEVFNRDEITVNTYYVDYSSGTIYYDQSQFGKVKIYNYHSRGFQLIGASRIYDEQSINGELIVKTLQDIINEGRKCLELIKSLGDAVLIIYKLDQNIQTGTVLNENLTSKIEIGTPLDASLKANIQQGNTLLPQLVETNTVATQKKKDLDESIVTATNTNQSATETNLTLQQTITSAQGSIDKINATGNKSLIIGSTQFVNNEYAWLHSMNNDNLIVNFMDSTTNEPLMLDYKIIDKNNILIRNSTEHPNIKVILSASYYQGNAVIGSTVEEFASDTIGAGGTSVRIKAPNGIAQNPITNSDAVFMLDGTTKLTKKISDIDTQVAEIKQNNIATKTELTTSIGLKVNKTDIVDSLVGGSAKVLSAEQGKVLNSKIDTKVSEINASLVPIQQGLQLKRDVSIKIKSDDLDISSNATKIKPIHISDELMTMFSPAGTVSPIIPQKGVTLDKLADGDKYEKKMGFFSDNIDMIDLSYNEKNITVKISQKNNLNATLYRMNVSGNASQNIAIPNNSTYIVANWETLIWDYATTTIRVVPWNTEIPKDSMVLLVNGEGKAVDGYFTTRYHEIHDEWNLMCKNVNIYLGNVDSLFIYNAYGQFPTIAESNGVYFKFDGLLHIVGNPKVTYSRYFDYIYNEVGSVNQDQSIDWVQGCIRIRENHSLVYDAYNVQFKVIPYSENNKSYYIPLVVNRNGRVAEGQLSSLFNHEIVRKSKLRENGIPTYYNGHLKNKENTVISKMDTNTFNFAFTTDNHVHEHMNMAVLHSHNILNKLDNLLDLEFVLNGGDTVPYGQDDKTQSIEALKTGINKFRNKKKYFNAQGNHDTNAKSGVANHIISNLISQNEIYKILGKHLDREVVWGDKEYMYYYKDLEDLKVRVIVLNNSDVPVTNKGDGTTTIDILETLGMRQKQVDWLANTALRFDNKADKGEWEVILVSHYFTTIQDVQGGAEWNNRAKVHEILKAFVTGTRTTQTNADPIFNLNVTADFISQGAKKIIGYFCGHCHYDFARVIDGIPFISSQADYKSNWNIACPEMIQGTYTEIAFDIVTVNKVTKNVKLTRFGAGEDREYNY